jgi:hypothetical protein
MKTHTQKQCLAMALAGQETTFLLSLTKGKGSEKLRVDGLPETVITRNLWIPTTEVS